jgi:hypothetical protein
MELYTKSYESCYAITGGKFHIIGGDAALSSPLGSPAFAGVRQSAFEIQAETTLLCEILNAQLCVTLKEPQNQKDAIKNLKNSARRPPWRRFV